ncbi:hypothetical protein AB8998_22730 [Mycobacterium sp. HUMS_12744610]|uniref:Uncharacterized protein n=1 Tax=Mycobacterium servetii TaxID=3237418 RepID=A0ABV4C4W4_9MYCO
MPASRQRCGGADGPAGPRRTALRALDEHFCDFATQLPAVRERLDWEQIRSQTGDNDFASAFVVLAEAARPL